MSSSSAGSSQEFTAGLGFTTARRGPPPSVVRPAPFALAAEPDAAHGPPGTFQPMVFQPFGGYGTIVSLPHRDETPAAVESERVEDVVADEPPPPDFEALAAEARQEGFQQGYEEGLRQAAEEQHDTGTRLSALLQGITSDTEALVRGLESQVVELALAIAEKVIAREARVDREIVLNVARSALSEIHDAAELRIRAHPDDVPLLDGRWQEMLPKSVVERSELVPDELVERGGVVVETRIGYADSQLKTRLNQVVTTFQAVLDGEPV